MSPFKTTCLPLVAIAVFALAGCNATMPTFGSSKDEAPAAESTATAPAAAPSPAPSTPKIGPGMNERGEVVDAKKVEAGYGQKVKGLDDWEGEVTGVPAKGSKFSQLKIGMSAGQVMGIVGQPTDQGAYVTGKAFIPFYFGSDRYRYETVYKGQGRLIFAGSAGFDSNSHLIWIIHSANEPGYR